MMVGLGAHNKFRLVPALQQGGQTVGRSLRGSSAWSWWG
jgi:hypothetical protein